MPTFRSRNRSISVVPVPAEWLWDVLSDPVLLAELTPLVDRIGTDGDRWSWTLVGISGLGVELAPSVTERMTFVPISRIDCRHEPPPGRSERLGVDGTYLITKIDDGSCKLAIDLTLRLQLPLPSLVRSPVERVLARAMSRTIGTFSRNLYRHLAVEPAVGRP